MIQSTVDPSANTAPTGKIKSDVIDARVALLNNFMGPHHWKQMRACSESVRQLSILLSTEMEPNRDWIPDWGNLDVRVQKNWMLTRKWKHNAGFEEDNYIHIPYDTGKQLKSIRPDVILSYEMGIRTLLASRYRSKNKNCRLVLVANVSEQTEQDRGRLRPYLRNFLRKRVDFVTYNGPSCRRYLLNQGYREDQLLHFPYLHDAAKVSTAPHSFSSKVSRLFYCGSLSERKGIVKFCKALSKWCNKMPSRQVELVMAGDGPLRLVVDTLDRPDNLKFTLLGNIGPEEIRRQYGLADISVFPTFADEWGLVVNESLASGLPILSSVLAQSTEALVQDGENGWTFDPTQPDSMANGIDRAMSTTGDELAQMSKLAIDSTQHITPEYSVDCFRKVVSAAMASRDP